MGAILVVSDLEKRFGGNCAVDHASFAVEAGSITGLIGPNGAGKTTCFNCISGFLGTDRGSIVFDGRPITNLPPHKIVHRGLVRTFQIPQEFASMTVLENCMLVPVQQAGERIWDAWLRPWLVRNQERAIETRARDVLDRVELGNLVHERAGNLSGGQKKLLELARALMARPKMVLLDEPAAGVNPTLARRLADHLKSLQRDLGLTFLIVEHDMNFVMRLCDPVIVMTGGRVLMEGPPAVVVEDETVQAAYLGGQYR